MKGEEEALPLDFEGKRWCVPYWQGFLQALLSFMCGVTHDMYESVYFFFPI